MSITYKKPGESKVREPLMQINRIKFKSSRSSLLENVETNILKIDLTRILNELNTIDEKILDNLEYFYPSIYEYTEQNKLNDGVSSSIDNINIYIDDNLTTEPVALDSGSKISGKLSRLFYKVTLLENGN